MVTESDEEHLQSENNSKEIEDNSTEGRGSIKEIDLEEVPRVDTSSVETVTDQSDSNETDKNNESEQVGQSKTDFMGTENINNPADEPKTDPIDIKSADNVMDNLNGTKLTEFNTTDFKYSKDEENTDISDISFYIGEGEGEIV